MLPLQVPLFMRDIYDSLTLDSSDTGEMNDDLDGAEAALANNRFRITALDIKAITDSDIIMSFANRGRLQEDLQWTLLFWFDTTELPPPDTEETLRAELRLYKYAAAAADGEEASFTIKCYQLVEGDAGGAPLLEAQDVRLSDEGWIILDVTAAAAAWQLDYRANQGLMVEIVRRDRPGMQLHPDAVGLRPAREETRSDREVMDLTPIIASSYYQPSTV